jgi:DNA-binding XRE family transcriptional regulator
MPAGRPTKYEESHCQLLIEHMAQGFSFESFAGLVGVSKQTIYDWQEANPQFLDSKKIGIERARLFWERMGIENIINKETMVRDEDGNIQQTKTSLNSTVWIFNMKNRFKDEWRDRQEIETTPQQLTVTISGIEPPPGE